MKQTLRLSVVTLAAVTALAGIPGSASAASSGHHPKKSHHKSKSHKSSGSPSFGGATPKHKASGSQGYLVVCVHGVQGRETKITDRGSPFHHFTKDGCDVDPTSKGGHSISVTTNRDHFDHATGGNSSSLPVGTSVSTGKTSRVDLYFS